MPVARKVKPRNFECRNPRKEVADGGRTSEGERARTRTCSYVHSLARIILVDGAPAGSINSSAPLYPVEGEITLEIITG